MSCKNLPYANICITDQCNLHCFYCQAGGENHCIHQVSHMTFERARKILDVLSDIGVSRIRITGGEPTLNPDFAKIVKYAITLDFAKIRISTNGTFIANYCELLRNPKIRVQISLDTLNERKFKEITNSNCFNLVMNSLSILSLENIITRINMVVTKSNYKEIPKMISYCEKKHFSIKLLGLEMLDCFDKQRVLKDIINSNEYEQVISSLGSKCNEVMAPGNLGISMDEYTTQNVTTRVRFFDGWGAKYTKACRNCDIFPCPSGIYGIQVLTDGSLSLCRFRRGESFIFDNYDQKELQKKLICMLDEALNTNNSLVQLRRVEYGISKFIEIPESIAHNSM